MTRLRLLLRNLTYFRGVNLSVIAGMAVATAVLTGALMVGDSVRASLRTLALQRLGPVDQAMISPRFFDMGLADRLHIDSAISKSFDIVPAVIVYGGASDDITQSKTSDVQIAALATPRGDGPVSPEWFTVPPGKCVINGELADELSIKAPGDSIVLSVPTDSDMPRDATLSRRGRGDVSSGLRVDVAAIIRDPGIASLFNPNGGQRVPRNAWVNLPDLQDAIDQPDRVNALLVQNRTPESTTQSLNDAVSRDIALDDYGLTHKLVLDDKVLSIGSRQTYLPPPVVEAVEKIATRQGTPLQKSSVSLIDSLGQQNASGPSLQLNYLVAAGITPLEGHPLGPHDMAINQWVADQLALHVGDQVPIDFYERSAAGNLVKASTAHPSADLLFQVKAILPLTGIGADPTLPPDYKGLTDADSVADWNPPEELPIDKKLVTKADEAYWKKYRASPKLFFSFETAEKLWGGQVTSLRLPSDKSGPFLAELQSAVSPPAMGMSFRPIKAEQLSAAAGGTDFSEYFLYFSFFLIVAAVLLVAMLFRLGIEQRARQLGLLGAVGFSPRAVRGLALREGSILAVVGALAGLVLAVGYAWLIMAGLRTWWVGAVGTTALHLHVNGMTLLIGLVAGIFVALAAVLWASWRLGRVPSASLLAGSWDSSETRPGGGKLLRTIGIIGFVAGLVLIGVTAIKLIPVDVGFLSSGGLLLCSTLVFLAGWLRPRDRSRPGFAGPASLLRLGFRNAGRHAARSVLAIGLVAFATFTLIVVAIMRQGAAPDLQGKQNGAGSYRLIVQTQIPIYADLNTGKGRAVAGLKEPGGALWNAVHFTQMRRWAGQDISCLNLTRPTAPAILSVPPVMAIRNSFAEASTISPTDNPWKLLDSDQQDAIPVIADDDTAQYVLNLPLGGEMSVPDQTGRPRKLRLVATLAHSIFQSELLMSDANFKKLFPSVTGTNIMLVDCWPHDVEEVRRHIGSDLDDYAVTVETPAARLASYQAVANTYLSTFQTLGSFGLLLGTIGLAVILIRTVVERRGELALLSCLGFDAGARVQLVLAENAFLLLLGLLVGSVCAVLGVAPAIAGSGGALNLGALLLTLVAVVVLGLAASSIAVAISGAHITSADLRHE